MTYQEIYEVLCETGLPVAYNFWESPENVPDLPYIIFNYASHNDYMADNTVYLSIPVVEVALYTSKKDLATEADVEAVLLEFFGPFQKASAWVPADAVQETLYTMEVIITDG